MMPENNEIEIEKYGEIVVKTSVENGTKTKVIEVPVKDYRGILAFMLIGITAVLFATGNSEGATAFLGLSGTAIAWWFKRDKGA